MRSAYRNDPEFQLRKLGRTVDPLDEVRVNRMIDNDAAVSRNYQELASQGLEDLYEGAEGSMTFDRYRKESIGDVQGALRKLFPDLELNSLGNPLREGTFRFTKGVSQGFMFKNLSGGEKAAFDLILDLVIARRDYDKTVFCIDEPEAHMNMRLQAELLSVLYELVPDNCQLMLATHSIGMMRRARDIELDVPGSVVFLDFGGHDFDTPQIIQPATPNRSFWHHAYEIALDDLAALVAPSRVVICEGELGTKSVDAPCYEQIFKDEFPDTRFVPMGGASEIENDKRGLAEALRILIGGLQVVRLIDRDDRSDEEVAELSERDIRVLGRRHLESYLFADEVLRALALSVGREDKIKELLQAKRAILARCQEGAADDLKRASGFIYLGCKRILGLTQCGNDTKTFMRVTLAPLINPDTTVYRELRCAIFGQLEEF